MDLLGSLRHHWACPGCCCPAVCWECSVAEPHKPKHAWLWIQSFGTSDLYKQGTDSIFCRMFLYSKLAKSARPPLPGPDLPSWQFLICSFTVAGQDCLLDTAWSAHPPLITWIVSWPCLMCLSTAVDLDYILDHAKPAWSFLQTHIALLTPLERPIHHCSPRLYLDPA